MTDTPARERPWGQALATFFVTLALGPPVGGIVFSILVAVMPQFNAFGGESALGFDHNTGVLVAFFVGLFAIPFSYFVGGVQAALTGLAFSVYGWQWGRPPFWLALAASIAAFAVAGVGGLFELDGWFVALLLVHAIPATFCWVIVRLFWPAVSA